MQFLIDTHILIWYLDGNPILPVKIRESIDDENNKVTISIVSLWELAIKLNIKKIETTIKLLEIEAYIAQREFKLLSISFKHLNALSTLPSHHRDPFDRLLIAQAIIENMAIITADRQFESYPINIIW
jgi:PIN domain nuclease of toxin-antitoxin system